MPSVGERKNPNMGNFSKDPMYKYAAAFNNLSDSILKESGMDYTADPVNALRYQGNYEAAREFFVENSVVGSMSHLTAEEIQDQRDMMNEAFTNDVQAIREHAAMGMSNYNPMVGLSLPMHKYLMMNCVFAQAVPRFVAKAPAWTETMETRYFVTPSGEKIDIANQQNKIYEAWKSANETIEVPMALPELGTIDILKKYFRTTTLDDNLSVATHICAVAVEEYAKVGDIVLTISDDTDGTKKVTEAPAESAGKALVWKKVKYEFAPSYGEYNRTIMQPVVLEVVDDAAGTKKIVKDSLFAAQNENMFEITAPAGVVKAVKMAARFDASARNLKTGRVEWSERTTFVQIPEADGITVPVSPEEVKDIGAMYGINQVTKYMSMIKDVMETVKDDDIKHFLDDSFQRLDENSKAAKTYDFAPPVNYMHGYKQWIQETFMDQLDQFITGLLTVLRDPNMQVCVLGRPGLIRMITPTEYTYTMPENVGPIELDFKKTVVTSDKRVYNFLSSDKLWTNDNLMILLIPKNTNRIVYRLYDYQMYISNEIRSAENPSLPALTAFQRYKMFGYQEVQGRLFIANPSGLRSHLPNIDPVGPMYNNNDLGSIYTHYDEVTKQNIPTENA